MGNIKLTMESMFEKAGQFVITWRWIVLVFVISLTATSVLNLGNLTLKTSVESFFRSDDPNLVAYHQFRDDFGQVDRIIVMVEAPDTIFDIEFLQVLKRFHEELEEELPQLLDIKSLVNARHVLGTSDAIDVSELLENLPANDSEMKILENKVRGYKFYRNLYVSEDFRFTNLILEVDVFSEQVPEKLISKLRQIIKSYSLPMFKTYLTGNPVYESVTRPALRKELGMLSLATLVLLGIVMIFFFRRISGILLPLLIIVLTVIFTFGSMGLTKTAVTSPTSTLPSLILAIGLVSPIHFLVIFYKKLNHNKENAIIGTFKHSGLPICLTGFTTMIGLLSFSASEIAPIADMGKFGAFGVFTSLFLTLTLIPALLSIFPIKQDNDAGKGKGADLLEKLLHSIGQFSQTKPIQIVTFSLLLMVFSIIGAFRLNFSHHTLEYLAEDSQFRIETSAVDKQMKGILPIEMVVDTGVENGLYSPEVLNKIGRLEISAKNQIISEEKTFIGKSISLIDIIKETNRALNENRESYYSIPQSSKTIAQELLLFENSEPGDVEERVDSLFSKTRITLLTLWKDSALTNELVIQLENDARQLFGASANVNITGLGALATKTVQLMMDNMAKSYLIAGFAITLMMILMLGSFRMGLLSMIPNIFPIVFALGMMGWLDIRLNAFNLIGGCVAIGLAVDDTIHFFHNFQRYYSLTGDVGFAIQETMQGTGRALVATTVILVSSFCLYTISSLEVIFNYGLIMAATILLALLADLLLAPALLVILKARDVRKVALQAK